MGRADSRDAVVDSELRVIGAKRLRVIDASIMPQVTVGNTNAPTIMIAERGADLIKEHWKNFESLNFRIPMVMWYKRLVLNQTRYLIVTDLCRFLNDRKRLKLVHSNA